MNKKIPQFIKNFFIATTLASSLFGCASTGIQSKSGEQVNDTFTVLSSGDARLTCGVSCSGAWGSSRRKQKGFYENELWNDLALEVAKVGFASDQSYFYLGRAAEGLGYRDAARTYYKLALSGVHKCAGWPFNNCDGLNFPEDINSRLIPLTSEVAREAAEKSTREAAEKSTREAAERSTREAAEKSTRKNNNKSEKKSTNKIARIVVTKPTNEQTEVKYIEPPVSEQPNAVTPNSVDGPFGLSWGSTESKVKSMGVTLIKTTSSGNVNVYTSTSLPKNISFAESYTLLFNPSQGLQKVTVVSKNINNDITGREGKELYETVKSQLTTKYSTPPKSTELTGLKLWKEYDEFYQCLKYSGCGLWVSLWEAPNPIALELKGINRGTGFLRLTYEGPAWSQIVDDNKNQSSKEDASAL
ncbi:MAG: hypothetical protein HOP25_09830 [Methylotenera sp.]|nr:hypothetical protein [Methylotenera sp.]